MARHPDLVGHSNQPTGHPRDIVKVWEPPPGTRSQLRLVQRLYGIWPGFPPG